ncbi:MAG: TetR/AcrR family transcriptional regulator [Lachnospiraceae bacterium]|nr:TetR/AcrR family transcriptional regulator [Lachnospiraceae bacterium]MBO7600316.1 TetR/AcrR family transcriptional regulator [Lachnospiraceae bacterium]
MARKEIISKNDILTAAFNMTREKGIEEVTARKLAAYAGCSTQPIFRNFENMEDCYLQVFEKSLYFFDDFYEKFDKSSHIPFVNLGLAYITFAQKESNLFSFLFIKGDRGDYNLYSKLNGRTGAVKTEMNMATEEGVSSPESIFMKMWMLIHGAACMSITGDFDLSYAETRIQLEEAYKAFVRR